MNVLDLLCCHQASNISVNITWLSFKSSLWVLALAEQIVQNATNRLKQVISSFLEILESLGHKSIISLSRLWLVQTTAAKTLLMIVLIEPTVYCYCYWRYQRIRITEHKIKYLNRVIHLNWTHAWRPINKASLSITTGYIILPHITGHVGGVIFS